METIQLNGKTFEFKTKTGKVLGTNKNMETRVSGGGGGGFSNRGTGYTAPVSITSSTTVHDQIFLEDSSGKEHAFQLSDFNVACREGNNLTVVSMFKANAKGYYVAVINHSTDKYYFDEGMINDMVKPNKWLLIGIVLLLTLLSIKMLGGSAFVFGLILAVVAFIYFSVVTNNNRKAVIEKIRNMHIQ